MFEITPRVRDALAEDRPVVALESTIITHGMPFPQNMQTAIAVEDEVRLSGSEPATIAIVQGRIIIGVEGDKMEFLAEGGRDVAKASLRDLAALIASGKSAGTTVAATMRIAAQAGIPVFATGGIGGVHRGAESSFDISADLSELACTPVAIVCAGAKSILDIGKTLEVIETAGVPVVGFRTDRFPAFFARDSGFPVDYRVDSVEDLANILEVHWSLGRGDGWPRPVPHLGGFLIANPVPIEQALASQEVNSYIDRALIEAEDKGVSGKNLTPFLLARLVELTDGQTLEANIALIKSNAALAGELAAAIAPKGPVQTQSGTT